MENMRVPGLSMAFIVLSLILSFAIPIIGGIYLRRRYGTSFKRFLTGAVIFVLFALVLENGVHGIVLRIPGVSELLTVRMPRLYAVYGGLMAGLFEETGRYVAFSRILKNDLDNDHNSLMYGMGHGGVEAMLLLGVAMINNLVYSIAINSGKARQLLASAPDTATKRQLEAVFTSLATYPPAMFLRGIFERLSAIALHLALSVLVFFAVKKRKKGLYFMALIIHAAVDAVTVLLSGMGVGTVTLEAVILIAAALACAYAASVWKKEKMSHI